MSLSTRSTTKPRPSRALPPGELGIILANGDGIKFRGGDRLVAQWPDGELLYCRVTHKHPGGKLECFILNGFWGLTFNSRREGAMRDNPTRKATIVMKLPTRLRGVRDMEDFEVVLAKAERQLERESARRVAESTAR